MVKYSLVFRGRKRQCEELQARLNTFLASKMPQHKPKSYVSENYDGVCIVEVAKSYRRQANTFLKEVAVVGGAF